MRLIDADALEPEVWIDGDGTSQRMFRAETVAAAPTIACETCRHRAEHHHRTYGGTMVAGHYCDLREWYSGNTDEDLADIGVCGHYEPRQP